MADHPREMDFAPVDMTSLVIVGNKATYIDNGLMITREATRCESRRRAGYRGTSDARAICQQLDAADVRYTLSVATPTGERLAGDIRGQIRCGRMGSRWLDRCLTPIEPAEPASCSAIKAPSATSRGRRSERGLRGGSSPRRADPADHRQQRSGGLAGGTGGETLLARVLPVPEVVQHQRSGFGVGRSSPSAGRSAPNLTPPFIASAGPMLW